jgi:hypothetical protein
MPCNSKHKEWVGNLGSEKAATLKTGIEAQENVIRQQSTNSSTALLNNYRVARLLNSEETLSGGQFARKCLHHIVQKIREEKETVTTIRMHCATTRQQV